MSVQSSASARYATSLLELAAERGELEKVKADVESFVGNLKATPELKRALASPVIPSEKKLAVLNQLYAERFTPLLNHFFGNLSRRGREALLPEIAEEFLRIYMLRKGYTTAQVISAQPLGEAALNEVMTLAERVSGMKIALEHTVDPALIGGFVLRIGDKQIDQSVASRLDRIRRNLKTTA